MKDATVTRVEFHDHGDKTRMTLSDGPFPEAARDGAESGWTAAFEKLAAHVGG
jgi:Activator of Hsp90 ATPase homolog 1-like protein